MASVELLGLRKRYDNAPETIKGVDLEVRDGEFMVFVGPSGCGKSTLLRMIAGLEDITGGELRIGSQRANDQTPTERGISMVFQSYALYPHMTVAENLQFGLRIGKVPAAERQERVAKAAEILQLTHLLDRKPKALSGGQRQRVAIGRAIVRKPKVFLFDEPLSNLDAALRGQMRVELARLHEELGVTMIYVTHDQVEAMTLGQRIAVFNQGSIEQVGTPLELYHQPANRFVAGFLGSPSMNFLPVAVEHEQGRPWLACSGRRVAELPTEAAALNAVVVGVRPDDLRLGQDGAPAQVSLVEQLGDQCVVYLRMAGLTEPLAVRLNPRTDDIPAKGDTVHVGFDVPRLHFFDDAGRARRLAA